MGDSARFQKIAPRRGSDAQNSEESFSYNIFMQQQNIRYNYILAEVSTATPQKLQLLLIEAAIKNIYRTKNSWADKQFDVALDHLAKAQDIVAEILGSLDVKGNPEIAKQLAAIYLFIFRRLAEAGMTNDEQKLDDALRILNCERETWQLVCDKFGANFDSVSKISGTATGSTTISTTNANVQYTPSTPQAGRQNSASVQLSTGTANAPSTFSKPPGAPFGAGVRPLGASPIQTNASLAQPKVPVPPAQSSGNSWDV